MKALRFPRNELALTNSRNAARLKVRFGRRLVFFGTGSDRRGRDRALLAKPIAFDERASLLGVRTHRTYEFNRTSTFSPNIIINRHYDTPVLVTPKFFSPVHRGAFGALNLHQRERFDYGSTW